MKKVLQVILLAVIVILGFLIVKSIQKPIEFNKERKKRYEAAIERLKDIRKAEVAYKTEKGKYTGNFDSLIHFIKYDSVSVEKIVGEYPDSLDQTEALKKGLAKIEKTKISTKDSLFSDNYSIDSLKYVPYTKGDTFKLGAGEVMTGSNVKVKVFEAAVKNEVLLKGLDKQLVINFTDEWEQITGYPGLKVGSLTEATNNAGNWDY